MHLPVGAAERQAAAFGHFTAAKGSSFRYIE